MELFKHFKERVLEFFNRILHCEDPPEDWQKAIVIILFKEGNKNNCDN
jgi:hypothetical protein